MGSFSVDLEIADPEIERWQPVAAMVDTGSTYTWIPRNVLNQIGISPLFQREFETADGRIVRRDMAVATIRLDGQTLPTLVVFGDEMDATLLGVVTLEEFSLGVDPVQRRLVPVRGLAMGR